MKHYEKLISGQPIKIDLSKTEKIPHPEVTFEIENYGTVKMELYPEYAPNTVANIIKLAESGYYDGKLIFGSLTNSLSEDASSSKRKVKVFKERISKSEKSKDKSIFPVLKQIIDI